MWNHNPELVLRDLPYNLVALETGVVDVRIRRVTENLENRSSGKDMPIVHLRKPHIVGTKFAHATLVSPFFPMTFLPVFQLFCHDYSTHPNEPEKAQSRMFCA
jgi:hypothetical protein